MSSSNTFQSWIHAGYELFACEGHEGIQVERLARIVGLNKSGFYHFFGDRDVYFERLMKHHQELADILKQDIDRALTFDPDFIHVMIKHKILVMVHMQLVRNRHIKFFADVYSQVNYKVDRAILPLWANYLGIPNQPELALRFYEMVRDMFYSRVNFETFSYTFISELTSEAKIISEELLKGKAHQSPSQLA